MIVYSYFMKMVFANKGIIFAYIIIFLVLAMMNSSSESRNTSFVETKLNIGVIDHSGSELSRSMNEYLIKKNHIIPIIDEESYIKEQIFLEVIDAVVIIPENFDELVRKKKEFMTIYYDNRKIEALQIQQQINKFLTFANVVDEDDYFDIGTLNKALEKEAKVTIIDAGSKVKSIGVNQWFKYYYNFTAYVIIAIYIAVIGFVMNNFAKENIERRIKISSKKALNFNVQIYLGQLTIAAIITMVFILGSFVLKGKYMDEIYMTKYVVNLVVFSFSILGLTFFLNNITNSKFAKNGLSTVLSLGTSFISGVMVPQELLSDNVLSIAKFFPTYYFVRINNADINQLTEVKEEFLMQILFAIVFFLLGLYVYRIKQGKKLSIN